MDGQYYNLWSTDNARTDANDEVVIKSVYDPSPVGYSLPAANAFTGFTTTGQNVGVNFSTPLPPEERAKFNVKGVFDKGWYFYTKPGKTGDTTFFSIFGYRDAGSGFLRDVPLVGWYWVAGPYDTSSGRYFYFVLHAIFPLDNYLRSLALAVRSAEERETHKFNIKQEMDGQYLNLWSTDNDRTDANDDKVIKSVYDPSPVGYSLPASNAFNGFTTTGQNTWNSAEYNVKGNFDNGWYFYTKPNKQGDTLFFRISGVRNPDSGIVDRFLEGGYFWTIGITNQHIGRSTAFENFSVRTAGFSFPSWAFAVRSAEEKEWRKVDVGCRELQHQALDGR